MPSLSTKPKLPPFAKAMIDRQRFKNPAEMIVIAVGGDAWEAAKQWNRQDDSAAMVLPAGESPAAFTWPVANQAVIVRWSKPAPEQLVVELVRTLLLSGAGSVLLWKPDGQPVDVYDPSKPEGERWQRADLLGVYTGRHHAKA